MFKLKHVEADNFLSFKNFKLALDNQGLILINGSNKTNNSFDGNGAGKSTIMGAIIWAMYGKTTNSLSADDVVNNQIGKNTCVKLYLEINGVDHRIERYRKHTKMKNTVKLYREDKDITSKSTKDTDAAIVDLLQVDYVTFTNAVFFGQGNVVTFANATDKERKEILERVTGIEVYRKAQDIAKLKVKEQDLEVQVLEREKSEHINDLDRLNELEETQEQAYAHTARLIEQATEYLKQLEQEYTEKDYKKGLASILTSMEELVEPEEPNVGTIPEDIIAIRDKGDGLQDNIDELTEAYNKFSSVQATYNAEGNELQRQLRGLDTSDKCPTCGSDLDVSHILKESTRIKEELSRLSDNSKQVMDKMDTLKQATDQYKQALSSTQSEYKQALNAYERSIYEESNTYKNEMHRLELEKREIEYRDANDSKLIKDNKKQLKSLTGLPKPEKQVERRNEIEMNIEAVEGNIELTRIAKTRYEDSVDMFSNKGIRSMVLDLVTPFLNERANAYSNVLTGGDIEINFSTQKENKDGTLTDKFDVEITNKNGGLDYKANSGGEKKRIDLAISFALQDLLLSKENMSTNIGLYDECFEALDMIGCESVIEVLREKQKQIGTIFVITHNEALKNLFETVITVEKTDGISRIKEEGHK